MYRALERPNVLDRLVAFLCDGQHMFFSYVSTVPGFQTDMRPGMREELEGFASVYDERLGQLVNRWLHERLREIELKCRLLHYDLRRYDLGSSACLSELVAP